MSGESIAPLTYVYAIAHGASPPSLAGVPAGLPGLEPPRLLGAGGGFWLVVASAPRAPYGAEAIQQGLGDLDWVSPRALAHDAVVHHVGRTATVLPAKLFTLFASDDRAVQNVAARRAALARTVARLAGRREWGVRARLTAPPPTLAGREGTDRNDGRGAGARYLRRKQEERAGARRAAGQVRREAELAYRALRGVADAARRQLATERTPGSVVVLDAAFLVPSRATAAFRATVRRWAGRLRRRGCALTLTGPWPPYTFVAERTADRRG
jgi:hypothetical protein